MQFSAVVIAYLIREDMGFAEALELMGSQREI